MNIAINLLALLHLQYELTEGTLKDIKRDDPPMSVVGKFLEELFTNHQLPTRLDPPSLLRPRSLTSLSLSHDFTQLLHYCPAFTQGQLIQMVVKISSGVPEAFEVFRCHPTTTEGELTLFLKRSAKHRLRSLVLEVNKLPFKLQEVKIHVYRHVYMKSLLCVLCNHVIYYL